MNYVKDHELISSAKSSAKTKFNTCCYDVIGQGFLILLNS